MNIHFLIEPNRREKCQLFNAIVVRHCRKQQQNRRRVGSVELEFCLSANLSGNFFKGPLSFHPKFLSNLTISGEQFLHCNTPLTLVNLNSLRELYYPLHYIFFLLFYVSSALAKYTQSITLLNMLGPFSLHYLCRTCFIYFFFVHTCRIYMYKIL